MKKIDGCFGGVPDDFEPSDVRGCPECKYITAHADDCPAPLRDEIADLRTGLRKLEWIWQIETTTKFEFCPACEGVDRKHEPDCWLAKLLEGK